VRAFTHLKSRAITALTIFSLMILTMVVQQASPSSASNLYYSGNGYDTSYPQCTATSAPTGFAIIGLGHGRPFTTNTCAPSEAALAGGASKSFYFNTGYALAYAKSDYADCTTLSASEYGTISGHLQSQMRAAWAIGCSESEYAMTVAPVGITPVAWWADIETGNSWSNNTVLNQATIDGIVYELHTSGAPVGVYSTPSMWRQITGTGYVNSGINADWQTGITTCPLAGFTLTSSMTTAPIWIIQNGTSKFGSVNFDIDAAC
jgi:hypothetical protein